MLVAIVFTPTPVRAKNFARRKKRVENFMHHRKSTTLATLMMGALGCFLPLLPTLQAGGVEQLQRDLRAAVNHPRFQHAQLGIKVVKVSSGAALFEHDALKLLKPASNVKLFTGALALDRLTPNFRMQTSAYSAKKPSADGRVQGDLIVYGRGDPSFSSRFHKDFRVPLSKFAQAIFQAGVRSVSGDLIADESYFNTEGFGPGWTWEDLKAGYGAEASALSVHDNVAAIHLSPGKIGQRCRISTHPTLVPFQIENRTQTIRERSAILKWRPFLENRIRIGGTLAVNTRGRDLRVTVRRPALWFAQLLRIELERVGIKIAGKARAINWQERHGETMPASPHHLTSIASPDVLRITRTMMKDSQNLYAQLLLLQVGAQNRRAGEDTDQAGIAALQAFSKRAGIGEQEMQLEDGAGLSRGGLVTPNAIVRLLTYMSTHQHRREFESTLAIAGRDGTLAGRFRKTRAEGNLRGKTGSLNFVHTLSGYVKARSGEVLAFSILLNAYPTSDGRSAVDRIALLLANANLK
jgi:serine-type D-Ala-D-Ala carboxypeptidase/endopeptidase (penicillin-binding protein 4)